MWAMGEGATVSDENSRLFMDADRQSKKPSCFQPTTEALAVGTAVRLLKKYGYTLPQAVELLRAAWKIVKVRP